MQTAPPRHSTMACMYLHQIADLSLLARVGFQQRGQTVGHLLQNETHWDRQLTINYRQDDWEDTCLRARNKPRWGITCPTWALLAYCFRWCPPFTIAMGHTMVDSSEMKQHRFSLFVEVRPAFSCSWPFLCFWSPWRFVCVLIFDTCSVK